MLRNTTFLILLAAAPFVFAADPAPDAAAMDKARMDAAIQFAETVLQHGRDAYGEKHTPLIPDMIEVDTLKAPETTYMTRVGRPGPRQNQPWQSVVQSDLAFQGNQTGPIGGIGILFPCGQEFSCKQRCACPSCHQKRALLTALHADSVRLAADALDDFRELGEHDLALNHPQSGVTISED
jgi:hypothetical protein